MPVNQTQKTKRSRFTDLNDYHKLTESVDTIQLLCKYKPTFTLGKENMATENKKNTDYTKGIFWVGLTTIVGGLTPIANDVIMNGNTISEAFAENSQAPNIAGLAFIANFAFLIYRFCKDINAGLFDGNDTPSGPTNTPS